ncbi:50S ribosomal protein L11 methyltransferase [Tahibacter amnicola]|uniref:Ribosomal protein L11 methyltransferase n=1 Tax=Tahibacter amnicola TaxID=2976241 RepID=A0ABY6BK70_9GAMM|nr:50S ribosomal protein L11 methyltransferase [Tahibacter amnicola]UXI68785.1 50S ribosomal protein L11 methyltransferase [Tahibacter amnicola]
MPWIELSLTLHADQQERIESALNELGALSVTLLDAEDHPIFEPMPGETPVWPTIKLAALFDIVCDRVGLVHVLTDLVPEIAPDQLQFRDVPDEDWTRAWMDTFQPMQFGRRLWIYPWNIEPPDDAADAVIVRLDPGLAFGTGTHPTTALCLEWLDGVDLNGKTVVDYGCGSGVLAIAALKLGAARVIGVDLDPQALESSRDNAERNGVVDALELMLPADYTAVPQDILVANILAGPLDELAPLFAASIKPGHPFALSGILAGQDVELLRRYSEWFTDLDVAQREDWVRISGCRR